MGGNLPAKPGNILKFAHGDPSVHAGKLLALPGAHNRVGLEQLKRVNLQLSIVKPKNQR
jgi:hypothetical protein